MGDQAYAAPQDMVEAYATLSNNGKQLRQTTVLKLERNGKVIDYLRVDPGKQATKEDTAYIISDILSDPNASYLSTKNKNVFTVGSNKVSTMVGVTNDASSAGTIQYSSKYVVGFWAFGGQDPSQYLKGFSELYALPIVSGWLTAAHQNQKYPERVRPSDVKELTSAVINLGSGPAIPGPSPAIDLYPSWYK
jgi:membrane peptidoglycan carboxypeptidase